MHRFISSIDVVNTITWSTVLTIAALLATLMVKVVF
jgi:hypothetical protein